MMNRMTTGQLQRYLDNTCTPEEKRQVAEWLRQSAGEELDTVLEPLWSASDTPYPDQKADLLWQRLRTEILSRRPVRGRQGLVRRIGRMAAAAAVLLLVGSLVWLLWPGGWTTVRNDSAIARQYMLPDGSQIWLNAHSSLQYSPDFNQQQRAVKVTGEAYFVVREDRARPFIVYTPAIATRVLGTEFNIEAYAGEPAVKVSLNKGSVAVSYVQEGMSISAPVRKLQPGEMLSVRTDKTGLRVQPIAVKKVQAWTQGHFVINDLSLPEIMERMEKRYGVRFHYAGSTFPAAGEHVAATFSGESWQQILQQIAFICDLQWTIKGKDIYLDNIP